MISTQLKSPLSWGYLLNSISEWLMTFLSIVCKSAKKWLLLYQIFKSDNFNIVAMIYFFNVCWWFSRSIKDELNIFWGYDHVAFRTIAGLLTSGLWPTQYVLWAMCWPYLTVRFWDIIVYCYWLLWVAIGCCITVKGYFGWFWICTCCLVYLKVECEPSFLRYSWLFCHLLLAFQICLCWMCSCV